MQLIRETVPVIVDDLTDILAETIVDNTALTVKSSVEFYFLNNALSMTLMTNPLLAAVMVIAAGGPKQTVGELGLRVSGVAVMLFTGLTFWPMALIKALDVVNYGLALRGWHLKRLGILKDPVVEVIKTTIENSPIITFFQKPKTLPLLKSNETQTPPKKGDSQKPRRDVKRKIRVKSKLEPQFWLKHLKLKPKYFVSKRTTFKAPVLTHFNKEDL